MPYDVVELKRELRLRGGIPWLLQVLRGIAVRAGGRLPCVVHHGQGLNAWISSDAERFVCFSLCGGRALDAIGLLAALEGLTHGQAIQRLAGLLGIAPARPETADERQARREREAQAAEVAETDRLHRTAIRAARAHARGQLDEHRRRLRALAQLGTDPDEIEIGLVDYIAQIERELAAIPKPPRSIAGLWEKYRNENAVEARLALARDAGVEIRDPTSEHGRLSYEAEIAVVEGGLERKLDDPFAVARLRKQALAAGESEVVIDAIIDAAEHEIAAEQRAARRRPDAGGR